MISLITHIFPTHSTLILSPIVRSISITLPFLLTHLLVLIHIIVTLFLILLTGFLTLIAALLDCFSMILPSLNSSLLVLVAAFL